MHFIHSRKDTDSFNYDPSSKLIPEDIYYPTMFFCYVLLILFILY